MPADRDQIRRDLRSRRQRLCSEDARTLSRAIWLRLFAMPAYREARRLLVYVGALENEVHTGGILDDALGRGVEVYIPIVRRSEKHLSIARLLDSRELVPGAFGIPEVAAERRVAGDPRELDAAIIPGVAFDRRGARLGFGQGYFDRFLESLRLTRIGVAYGFQLVHEVPLERWDVPMHYVVTESGVIDCRVADRGAGPAHSR